MGPSKPPEWDQKKSSKKHYWLWSRRRRRLRSRKHGKSPFGVALDMEGPSVGQQKRGHGLLHSSSSNHPYTSGMGLRQLPLLTTPVLPLPPPPALPPWPLDRPQRLLLPACLQKPIASLRFDVVPVGKSAQSPSDIVPIGISGQSPLKDTRRTMRWDHLWGSMGHKAAKQSCPMSTSEIEIALVNDTTVPSSDVSSQNMDRSILGKKVERPQRQLLPPRPQKPIASLRSDVVPIGISAQSPSNIMPIGISTRSPLKDTRRVTRWDLLSSSVGQKAAKCPCLVSKSKVEIAVANDTTVAFSDVSSHDMGRRILGKKARLAWGDGLAKYEKQKVQGPSDLAVVCTKIEPGKVQESQDSLMVDTKSDPVNTVGVAGPEACPFKEPVFSHKSTVFQGISRKRTSSQKSTLGDCVVSEVDSEHKECATRSDCFPIESVSALKPFLNDLLQPKDTFSGHLSSATSISFKQILRLKADILKELEQTDCEIDIVEREIKSLNSGAKYPLILSTTDYVAKEMIVSNPPKDHVQLGGDYLQFQSKQENSICAVNLEHTALADYDSGKLPVISSRCEGKLLNSNVCCPEYSLTQSTVATHSHEVDSNKVHKEKDAPMEQLALTKPATKVDDNAMAATEKLEVISKLLSESKTKACGSSSRMPSMTLGKKEESSKFNHKKGLIEDPLSYEAERTRIRPWSQQEMEVFVEMLVTFGKDFAKISSFLSDKTTADCVEYYYKNHRTESFVEAKKRFLYTRASQRKYARKKSVAALYILEGSTVASAENYKSMKLVKYSTNRYSQKSCRDREAPRESKSGPYKSGDSDFDSSKVDRNEWTDNERSKFVQAIIIHGKIFTKISRYLCSRSIKECKTYFAKTGGVLNFDTTEV